MRLFVYMSTQSVFISINAPLKSITFLCIFNLKKERTRDRESERIRVSIALHIRRLNNCFVYVQFYSLCSIFNKQFCVVYAFELKHGQRYLKFNGTTTQASNWIHFWCTTFAYEINSIQCTVFCAGTEKMFFFSIWFRRNSFFFSSIIIWISDSEVFNTLHTKVLAL